MFWKMFQNICCVFLIQTMSGIHRKGTAQRTPDEGGKVCIMHQPERSAGDEQASRPVVRPLSCVWRLRGLPGEPGPRARNPLPPGLSKSWLLELDGRLLRLPVGMRVTVEAVEHGAQARCRRSFLRATDCEGVRPVVAAARSRAPSAATRPVAAPVSF